MKAIGKLALYCSLALCCCPAAVGLARAEFKLYPSLAVSEIYDDNLFNAEHDETSEFVTRLMPSLALDYQQARVDMTLAYTLEYRIYAKGERDNEAVNYLDFLTLLNRDERYFLEVSDRLAQVSLSSTRNYGEESLFANQSDQNIFSLSPYLQLPTTSRGSLRTGYQFIRTTYQNGDGIDKTNHRLFAEQTYELTERARMSAGYEYLKENSDDNDFDKHDLYGGLRYQFGENSSAFGTLGHTWIDFSNGVNQSDFFWDFGLTRDFDLASASVALGVSYLEDPEGTILRDEHYRISVARDWSRSRLSLSASLDDFYDTDIDAHDTRRYGGTGSFSHEISRRLTGSLIFSGFKYEEDFQDTWTRRLIGSVAFAYLLAEDFTSTLTFYRIDSHSPQVPEDRFETDRIFLELKKVF